MTTLYDAWKIKPSSKYLDGEDVDLYENYQLAPDVRPESIYRKGVTIRNMPNKDYERLKRFSSKRDGGRCKCCKRMLRGGGEGDWWKVDELLEYDFYRKIATIKSIITVCKTCWSSRHLVLSKNKIHQQDAINNLKKVRGFSDEQINYFLASNRWAVENGCDKWSLDVSLLTNNGFTLYTNT